MRANIAEALHLELDQVNIKATTEEGLGFTGTGHVLKFTSYELRKYVENYLNSIDLSKYISGGAQPKLNQDNLNKITIPIPNIERVKYVVSILDRFDTLCNDLSTGLPAEIETRQKQYEYYRDKLLSFEKIQK